ncbi:MAG: prolipoprotein diacylglyceryl transferase [Anaerolineae bacterium]|nr:prolipoprotein diacylglyceryl transferase [Anaerolineae bacterium]
MLPILYENGPVIIYTHDFFTVIGLLVGLALYYHELHKRDMLEWRIFWISIAAVFGAGVGCRLLTAWEHPAYYSTFDDVPFSYFVAHSGKTIIGGIVGGYVGIVLSKRYLHYTKSTGDCYAAAIALATAIGRIGCFLSELPLGKPTDLPWGMTVSADAISQFQYCPYCTQPMHPSMVYEIIFNLIAFALILRLRHRVIVQGETLKIYLLAAGIFRFFVEFVRGNTEQLWGLTGPQVVLIPCLALLIYYFIRQWRSGVYRMPAPPLAYSFDNVPDQMIVQPEQARKLS